ncbi:hypothetical protein DMENIID0001_164410 [Sergentomyia squamirostris]
MENPQKVTSRAVERRQRNAQKLKENDAGSLGSTVITDASDSIAESTKACVTSPLILVSSLMLTNTPELRRNIRTLTLESSTRGITKPVVTFLGYTYRVGRGEEPSNTPSNEDESMDNFDPEIKNRELGQAGGVNTISVAIQTTFTDEAVRTRVWNLVLGKIFLKPSTPAVSAEPTKVHSYSSYPGVQDSFHVSPNLQGEGSGVLLRFRAARKRIKITQRIAMARGLAEQTSTAYQHTIPTNNQTMSTNHAHTTRKPNKEMAGMMETMVFLLVLEILVLPAVSKSADGSERKGLPSHPKFAEPP